MAKYSNEFKLQVVKEYLTGKIGLKRLAKKYSIPSNTAIRTWVAAYKAYGNNGIKRKRNKEVYPVQFKVDVLHFMKQTGASYQETAIQFKMNNPRLIAKWNQKFLKEGIEGLQEKAKGRPSMSKKPKPAKQEKELSREEQLERENELLRLEVAYLKKLKAFRENPEAFLGKHKQPLPLNSKKKDSD